MNENFDEETTIKNRIMLREINIRKMTTKYMELLSKFNTLTRNEIAAMIKDIMNEIEMLEIALLKAENYERIKVIDNNYQQSLKDEIGKHI